MSTQPNRPDVATDANPVAPHADRGHAAPRSVARDLAVISVFAGLIAVLGLIPALYPFGQVVPITAQSLGIMLCGAVLGPRRGALAVLLLLGLVAVGLPLLAGGRGGLAVFAGASVGYLIGWPIAAWAIGVITHAVGAPYRLGWGIVANIVGGVLLLHLLGIVGMMLRADLSIGAALAADVTFIPGDVVKAVIAGLVARGVHAAYPGLLPRRRMPAGT